MKVFVDENIPKGTVEALRQDGHDVKDIRGTSEEGISDEEIWEKVKCEGRVLIATDRGFAQHRGEPHAGILVVCLKQPSRLKIHQRVMRGLYRFSQDEWVGKTLLARDRVWSLREYRGC